MPGIELFMKRRCLKNDKGFTLVELMVTVFLTAIAVIAIYRGYTAFSQSADAQQQTLEMQQNLRIGMYWLVKDIMRAGMNEEDEDAASFSEAFTNSLEFSMDLWGAECDGGDCGDNGLDDNLDGNIDEPGERDGRDNDDDGLFDEDDEQLIGDGLVDDEGEVIAYYLVKDQPTFAVCPAVFDPDVYPCVLYREDTNAGSGQKLITNVDALNFVYLDETRTPLPVPGGGMIQTDRAKIRSIQICLVVRTTNEDYRYNNNESYVNIDPTGADEILPPQGDNFRRRAFCEEIKIRNAGL